MRFSHFRSRDGTSENCFFQMSFVHVHLRAYVCIINEKANSLENIPWSDLGKQNILEAKAFYCQISFFVFLRAILKCTKE